MKPKTIITCLQNILPLFSTNIKHGLQQKHFTIFTNKYASTLSEHRQQIEDIRRLKNSKFIPNYQSALSYLKNKNKQVILLVGDPHHNLHQNMKGLQIITLQQMCAIFPQKVPLSYRSQKSQQLKKKIEKRMEISLQRQPQIKHILLTSHNIKMWDQAIQVILDHSEADIVVQYEQPQNYSHELQTLKMDDFITSLSKCHEIVHNKTLPKLINFNKNNMNIQWIMQWAKKRHPKNVFVVDQDLVNQRQKLTQKGIDVERVDQNSQLWY